MYFVFLLPALTDESRPIRLILDIWMKWFHLIVMKCTRGWVSRTVLMKRLKHGGRWETTTSWCVALFTFKPQITPGAFAARSPFTAESSCLCLFTQHVLTALFGSCFFYILTAASPDTIAVICASFSLLYRFFLPSDGWTPPKCIQPHLSQFLPEEKSTQNRPEKFFPGEGKLT